MKRIIDLTNKYHEKHGGPVCITLNVWKFKSGTTEQYWELWDGEETRQFKTFQSLTDWAVLERGV